MTGKDTFNATASSVATFIDEGKSNTTSTTMLSSGKKTGMFSS